MPILAGFFLYHETVPSVRRPREALQRAGSVALGLWGLLRLGPAAPSPINQTVGPRRRLVLADVLFSEIEDIRCVRGGRVNDVVLALAASCANRIVAAREDLAPGATLRATVPVSTRPPGEAMEPGSWTSAFSVELPVGPMSFAARLAAIQQSTRTRSALTRALTSNVLMSVAGAIAPPPLHAKAARFALAEADTVVTVDAGSAPSP